ncbi:MAG: ABC transporter permease [Bryobacteraceae bacterium]|nr:ABC transporter permease [Bryobacteraceae bacterium]
MLQSFREIREYQEFLLEYVLQILRSRYRGSVLGFLWTLLNPLLVCVTFGLVFSVINNVDIRGYLPHFLSGYIPWLMFVGTGTAGTSAIIGNSAYVSRIYVPKAIFPIAAMLINLVDLLSALAVFLFLLAIFQPTQLGASILFLPVAILIMAVFCLGIAFLFATLSVFFRDFVFLWSSLSFVWFFFTPIIYKLDQMPASARPLFSLNIAYPFIRMFQDPIAGGVLPSAETIMAASFYATITFIVGSSVFFRSERRFYMYV